MSDPTREEWRELYGAAVRVKELRPWGWMEESDVFVVENPESGEPGLVSVMGMLGEFYAVSVYVGSEGIHGFLDIQEMGPFADADSLIRIPQIHASFESRDDLDRRDYAVIKDLGLKFRGRNEWPMFRSYEPFLLPWFIEADEARFLKAALDQLLEVAPRFRENLSLLDPSESGEILTRRREGEEWKDSSTGVPPLDAPPIEAGMDGGKMEALASLETRGARIEVDFFMLPASVGGEGERPYFPHMLLAVDGASGLILGTELLAPHPSPEAMWGSVPEKLSDQLLAAEFKPERVSTDSDLLFALLDPLAKECGFELELAPSLPSLDEVREELLQTFGP